MRRWIRLAASLYPKRWRARYGAEFDALLEDIGPGWRDALDVLRGALEMNVKAWGLRNIMLAGGLAGAILAAALAFRTPDKYVSTAVIGVESAAAGSAEYLHLVQQEALSQSSLAQVIQKQNLYLADRRHMPLESVIERMRRDIRLGRLDTHAGEMRTMVVQYSYGNPAQAQKTTSELISKLLSANLLIAGRRESGRVTLEVLDPASLPRTPVSPNRPGIVFAGIGAGLLMAGLAASAIAFYRRPAKI